MPDTGEGHAVTAADVERVFVAHYDDVYRLVLRLVHQPTEAHDLTQETFTRAYQALPGFRGESTLKTWLARIAQNIVLDHFRRRSREHAADTLWLDAADVQALPGRDTVDQAQASQQHESNACVQRCVDHLADHYRQAVVLHDMVGMTNGEIAAMLGVSLATVKIRVHRGRQRLRSLVAQHCEIYRDERNEMGCQPKRGGGDR
jgi:RNA polymerase sigma-70 factor, ECF subfamily